MLRVLFFFAVLIWICSVVPIRADDEPKPKVLVIKHSDEDESHLFITKALAPARRGGEFDITVADADALTEKPLDEFASIYLNDVAELTNEQHNSLNKAVRGGVSTCFFVGPTAKLPHYNEKLYAEGKGIFPLPLGTPLKIASDVPGVVAARHPVLDVFRGDAKAMLDIVLISQSHRPADGWNADDVKGLNIIARSTAGHPVALSKSHGNGNVVVYLFVPDRRWANWHFYPAWVVMMHELQTFMTEY